MGHGVKKPQMVHKQPGKKWPVTDNSQPVKGVRKPAACKTRLQHHVTSYSQFYNSKLQFNNQAQDLKKGNDLGLRSGDFSCTRHDFEKV
jgi:hypothetical protein